MWEGHHFIWNFDSVRALLICVGHVCFFGISDCDTNSGAARISGAASFGGCADGDGGEKIKTTKFGNSSSSTATTASERRRALLSFFPPGIECRSGLLHYLEVEKGF